MKTDNTPYLYILMRTDLDSMNAGKAVAQGAHAANQFVYEWTLRTKTGTYDSYYVELFDTWQRSTPQGFGTTISLGVNEKQLLEVVEFVKRSGFLAGVTHDPSYPLIDGKVLHLLPLNTCGYVFGAKDKLAPILSQFNLLP